MIPDSKYIFSFSLAHSLKYTSTFKYKFSICKFITLNLFQTDKNTVINLKQDHIIQNKQTIFTFILFTKHFPVLTGFVLHHTKNKCKDITLFRNLVLSLLHSTDSTLISSYFKITLSRIHLAYIISPPHNPLQVSCKPSALDLRDVYFVDS